MTEPLETFDFEYSYECDSVEEEVDRLNAVTFGNEIEWNYDGADIDDSNFEKFPFSDFESRENIIKNENSSNDLLGLKGSLFNFESFKNIYKCENEQIINKRDSDFEIAINKLDLLGVIENKNNITRAPNDAHGVTYSELIETPLMELTKYSEILHIQFLDHKKSNNNSQFLNGIVAKHLNLLSKKLSELSLSMDVLAQLNYFRILTTFVSVDNRVNEIRTKCSSNPRVYNAEIGALMQHFLTQTPQQQEELASIHPFYSGIFEGLRNQIQLQSTKIIPSSLHAPVQPQRQWSTPGDYGSPAYSNEGGWMTGSERDWIAKVQTRNLVSDNPYMQDYYYTMIKFREMAAARDVQLSMSGHSAIPDPITLLPSPITADHLGAGTDPSKEGVLPAYSPAQFENSLGVLTSCNINTPRQTIQVPPRHRVAPMVAPDNGTDPYRPIRCQRELLAMIEKLHCTVLRVDEVDKSMAKMLVEQHQNRAVLLQHRSYLVSILMDTVNSNVRIVQMFSVAKGARILASVMAIVSSVQFLQLMRTFFFNCLSIWESDHFGEFEADFRSIIVSRIRNLQKDELSLLITTFFCNMTSRSFNDKVKLQPLSGFCRCEFGLYIVFTVLDVFFNLSPEDKSNVQQLVAVTVRSADSKTVLHKMLTEFRDLFQSISDPK